ncbi:MAG: high-potential iron-sulfur protein [Pseudomonadota bacterium]
MHDDDLKTDEQRRKLVKLAASTAVVLPLTGLVACSGDDSSGSATEQAQAAADSAADAADEAANAAADMADDAATAAGDMADDAMDAASDMAGDASDAMADAADTASDAMDDAKDAAADMADDAKDAVSGAAGGLPELEESDPVAQALGYKHDASEIDTAKYPGRGAEANEYCRNCALYVAGGGGWGACSIFAGKAVNAEGWCASYNRMS